MSAFVASLVCTVLLPRRSSAHGLVTQPLILINRFMINLRTVSLEMRDHSVHITVLQQGHSTVQFRRPTNRLGNFGEVLQNGWDDNESRDEESDPAEVDEAGHGKTSAEA